MRRKCTGWWEVTTTHTGLYYSERKWMEYKDVKNASTHASFLTKKRAMKNAVGLLQKTNCEVVVLHWYYRKGRRYLREWIAKEVLGE